ncbi:hypothetical protein PIB30_045961 [Stylosanthes scabra]|uniref:Uncharacterized protein n=1 Tax=Stylosanthes scabra TaxID=79078 RepID=A0ABU6RGI3_9FABA|nr:hypothetical protein [Stylosanthes scabra]
MVIVGRSMWCRSTDKRDTCGGCCTSSRRMFTNVHACGWSHLDTMRAYICGPHRDQCCIITQNPPSAEVVEGGYVMQETDNSSGRGSRLSNHLQMESGCICPPVKARHELTVGVWVTGGRDALTGRAIGSVKKRMVFRAKRHRRHPRRNGPKESEKESRGSGGGPNGITKRKG